MLGFTIRPPHSKAGFAALDAMSYISFAPHTAFAINGAEK